MPFSDDYPDTRRRESGYNYRFPVDRMFDEFFSEPFQPQEQGFIPSVNISDGEKEITVRVELPGMDADDVEISLSYDGLLLRGEKREERADDERSGYYEFTYGSFQRFIPLYSEVDQEKTSATFEKGVLKIVLPKSEEGRTRIRKIPVQSSDISRNKAIDVQSHDESRAARGATSREQKIVDEPAGKKAEARANQGQ
ncbi:MAG: Hsp20/alpha crystallin family protein [Deltaproteobacteria bacterium]|nr:Hsp20/alpha crystallin family protein [Deltaproteobacteria bacterium]